MLDNISLALSSLRSNKMRALLTMLGLIIGIGAVIAIETVGRALTGSISSSMGAFGASHITVRLAQKESGSALEGGEGRVRFFLPTAPGAEDRLTSQMLEEYRAAFAEQIDCLLLTQSVGQGTAPQAAAPDETVTALLMGAGDEYAQGSGLQLLYGRWLDNEKDGTRRVCVASDRFVQQALGLAPQNAIGQSVTLTVNSRPYTFYIQGVYAYQEENEIAGFGTLGEAVTELYMPLDTARRLTGAGEGFESFTVVARTGVDIGSFLQTTSAYFASYYTRNDAWTVEASSMATVIESMEEMLSTVSLAVGAIAGISLLVGGIGVMNTMLISVAERTREIGVRKALGAPGWAIRAQFLVEAVVICLLGGILGALTGVLLGMAAAGVMGYQARPSTGGMLLAAGASAAIGVFFGYYPAGRAARLDPIEALRYE